MLVKWRLNEINNENEEMLQYVTKTDIFIQFNSIRIG